MEVLILLDDKYHGIFVNLRNLSPLLMSPCLNVGKIQISISAADRLIRADQFLHAAIPACHVTACTDDQCLISVLKSCHPRQLSETYINSIRKLGRLCDQPQCVPFDIDQTRTVGHIASGQALLRGRRPRHPTRSRPRCHLI